MKRFEDIVKYCGVSYRELEEGKKPLEALGLLRTYYREDQDGHHVYSFFVYPPLSPKAFFSDVLLAGELLSTIGEERFEEIKRYFQGKNLPQEGKDISLPFSQYFHPDFLSTDFSSALFPALADAPAKIQTGFDVSQFDAALSASGFHAKIFSEEELRYIEECGALYGYPSDTLGGFVADCLSPRAAFGARLNKDMFLRRCREAMKVPYLHAKGSKSSIVDAENDLTKKMRMMDSLPPSKWLQILQKNHRPATADLKLIEKLTLDMGLPGPACNALLDYVLQTNENRLSPAYCEKVAASLVRAGVDNARDTMELLNSSKKKAAKTAEVIEQKPAEEKQNDQPEVEEEKPISDAELDALFDEAYGK